MKIRLVGPELFHVEENTNLTVTFTILQQPLETDRSIKPFMSLDVLRSTYFSYGHSIISYGIKFWGNSSYSEDIFKIQKGIIRIIIN